MLTYRQYHMDIIVYGSIIKVTNISVKIAAHKHNRYMVHEKVRFPLYLQLLFHLKQLQIMDYQHFLFSQLFMNHIETNQTRYKDLSYDIIYVEVLIHLDEFISSNFNVNTKSEYDCITDYLSHNI